MDLVPVIIISKQQGVPIPNNDFSFRVSNEDFEKTQMLQAVAES